MVEAIIACVVEAIIAFAFLALKLRAFLEESVSNLHGCVDLGPSDKFILQSQDSLLAGYLHHGHGFPVQVCFL